MTTELAEGVWQPLPDEPERWYARFEHYRRLGPERSIAAAYRADAGAGAAGRPSKAWYSMAARWRWAMRAEAWDEHTREQRHAPAAQALRAERVARLERALAFHEQSSPVMERVIALREQFAAGLAAANLATLDQASARRLVNQLRKGFVEMIELERIELGEDPQPRRRRRKKPENAQVVDGEQLSQELLRRLELVYGNKPEPPAVESDSSLS